MSETHNPNDQSRATSELRGPDRVRAEAEAARGCTLQEYCARNRAYWTDERIAREIRSLDPVVMSVRQPDSPKGTWVWVAYDGNVTVGDSPRDALRRALEDLAKTWRHLAEEGQQEPGRILLVDAVKVTCGSAVRLEGEAFARDHILKICNITEPLDATPFREDRYWTDERIREAMAEVYDRFEALDLPDAPRAPTVWAGGAYCCTFGMPPREAAWRFVQDALEGWLGDALMGIAREDYLPMSEAEWEEIASAGPVTLQGARAGIETVLEEIRPTGVTVEPSANLSHWTPEARRAAIDRFWSEVWPELVDQVPERPGPHLWISREETTHAGWTAREAFRAAMEHAVCCWDDSADQGEAGPDEGPEAMARACADGWAFALNGPVEMVATLLRDLPIKQCNAFAEELLATVSANLRGRSGPRASANLR